MTFFGLFNVKLNKKASPSLSCVSIYSNNDISRYVFLTNILYLFRLISQYTSKPIYRDSLSQWPAKVQVSMANERLRSDCMDLSSIRALWGPDAGTSLNLCCRDMPISTLC